MRITRNSIVTYGMQAFAPPRSKKQVEAQKNLTRGLKNGFMSEKTKQKVKRILKCWIEGTEQYRAAPKRKWLPKIPYFTFVTLTLSSDQRHTDKEIKRKMVTPFIQVLKRKHNVWHYLYVCEKQENGNLHIHLLTDSYIHHSAIRKEWNEIQDLNGYIQPFFDKWGHRNPNSTDIHKLEKVHNVQAYLIKYMTKDQKDRKIDGRLWGCSDSLRKLKHYSTMIESKEAIALSEIMKNSQFQVTQKENYTLITGKIYTYLKARHKKIFDEVNDYNRSQIERLYKIHPSLIEKQNDNHPLRTQIELLQTNSEPGRLRPGSRQLQLFGEQPGYCSPSMRSMVQTSSICKRESR